LEAQLKYLALGDSYTIGESVEPRDRWPNQLTSLLNQKGFQADKPVIIAATGWRSDNLMNAVAIANLKEEYDLVSLLIGVNNQYQARPVQEFEMEFEKLLNTCIRLARGKKENTFVVSIPDYGFTPFGLKNKEKISVAIDQFNESIKKICEKLDVKWIYITDISREGLNNPELIASDGLHPSEKMYALWAKQIGETLSLK
jgi:lysophospholipase L1-like esterase